MSDYSELSFSEDEEYIPSDLDFAEVDCVSEDSDYIPDTQPEEFEYYTEYPDSQ
jgi:hypothetical protein